MIRYRGTHTNEREERTGSLEVFFFSPPNSFDCCWWIENSTATWRRELRDYITRRERETDVCIRRSATVCVYTSVYYYFSNANWGDFVAFVVVLFFFFLFCLFPILTHTMDGSSIVVLLYTRFSFFLLLLSRLTTSVTSCFLFPVRPFFFFFSFFYFLTCEIMFWKVCRFFKTYTSSL